MAPASPTPRVLVIDLDGHAAATLRRRFSELGADTVVVAEAAEAPLECSSHEAWDLVLCSARKATSCMLRIRELSGDAVPTFFAFGDAAEATRSRLAAGADGYVVTPITRAATASILDSLQPTFDAAERYARMVRRLFGLTLLDANVAGTVDGILRGIADCFGATDCVLWNDEDTEGSLHTATERSERKIARLLEQCRLAVSIGSTTFFATEGSDDGAARSLLGVRLQSGGGADLGGLCLVDDRAKCFTDLDRDALQLMSERLALELVWMSAHDRLAVDHERLRASALDDPLTGLWTRPAFEHLATAEIAAADRRGEDLSLAILDVAGLRAVNDQYGHLAGDAVLTHVARTLQANLRASDLIGRVGDDEIAVLLGDADLECAHGVLAKLVDLIAASPSPYREHSIAIRAVAGLTRLARSETTAESALGRATSALAEARARKLPIAARAPATKAASAELAEDAPATGMPLALPAGSTLGGAYRIIHEVSRGAMGVVYRAEDMGLGRPVAIKVLRSDLARDEELVKRFREEAAILASLHHPHLVQVYSFGAAEGEVYFVMELVEGQSLADVILRLHADEQQIDVEVVIKVVEEIADALESMHAVGLIHRDVKPANVLLDKVRERAVLVDVGVAIRRGVSGQPAGTPGFAAPESFTEAAEGPSTDVYGLAATMYMTLTGSAPFGGGGVLEVIDRQMNGEIAPASSLRPDLSSAVDSVLRKALDPQQAERFGSAGAFAVALSSALGRLSKNSGTQATERSRAAAPSSSAREVRAPARKAGARRRAEPQTRGAVFRVAQTVLSRSLGTSWIRKVAQDDDALAEVLKANLSPASWHPLRLLTALLERAAEAHDRPHDLSTALGRSLMTVTFARFFGADPGRHEPLAVLRAAEAYWPRYHDWGQIRVEGAGDSSCRVTFSESPGSTLVCAFIGGSLTRIAELSGAADVQTAHVECACKGDAHCVFVLTWRPSSHPSLADTERRRKS